MFLCMTSETHTIVNWHVTTGTNCTVKKTNLGMGFE